MILIFEAANSQAVGTAEIVSVRATTVEGAVTSSSAIYRTTPVVTVAAQITGERTIDVVAVTGNG